MSWAEPFYLLLLLLPVVMLIAVYRREQTSQPSRWKAMQKVAVSGERIRTVNTAQIRPACTISLIAILLGIIALARPLWGEQSNSLHTSAREVMIAFDLSRSMLATDVEPTRFDQTTALTEGLLDALEGERVGLIVFAGTAFVQVPMSPDYQIIREFLPELGPDYMPRGGSDYTAMLNAALEGFGEEADVDRYLVILSDGESTTDGWQDLLDELSDRRIHVLSVGIGTEAGGFLDNGYGGYYKDAEGNVIHSKLQPATLEALANRTDGSYFNVNDVASAVDSLVTEIRTGKEGQFEGEGSAGVLERFQWFLLPAVLLVFAGLLREFHPRPAPRAIRRNFPGNKFSPGAVAVMACYLVAGSVLFEPKAFAHFDSQADFEVQEVFDSNPVDRLRAIVRHLAEFDYDAYDLRLMVEATLKYGIDEKRLGLVPDEGVIRDAIEATHQGEALDNSIANWSFYRERLKVLLERPKEQEEPEQAERPPNALDEEDAPPMVAGQSTQQAATDSFGQGASAKTDAALGDMTAPDDLDIKREAKPPPPKSARMAALRASREGSTDGTDPILSFSRQRLEEVSRRDSPGRLHQLLSETVEQQTQPQEDW